MVRLNKKKREKIMDLKIFTANDNVPFVCGGLPIRVDTQYLCVMPNRWEAIESRLANPLSDLVKLEIEYALGDYLMFECSQINKASKNAVLAKLRRWLSPGTKKNLDDIKRKVGMCYNPFASKVCDDELRRMRFWLELAIDSVELSGGDVTDKATIRKELSNNKYRKHEQVKCLNKQRLMASLISAWKHASKKNRISLTNYPSKFNQDYKCQLAELGEQFATCRVSTPANMFLGECLYILGLRLMDCEEQLRDVVDSSNELEPVFEFMTH